MEKKKTTAKIVLSLGEIVLGNIMYAAAVVLFIVPNGLITGGTTGLALFVNHSIGIPISLFVSVFNVLMFLLGAWVLGKQFALTTVLSTIIYGHTGGAGGKRIRGLCAGGEAGGGALCGTAHRRWNRHSDAGRRLHWGDGYTCLVLKKKLDVNVSMTLYLMDCVVLGLQLIAADSHAVLYGIILIIVYTMVLNQVLMWGNARIQVKIVSRKHEEINRLIAERIDCGTSLLHMETGYLHREQEMILAVISRRDLPS